MYSVNVRGPPIRGEGGIIVCFVVWFHAVSGVVLVVMGTLASMRGLVFPTLGKFGWALPCQRLGRVGASVPTICVLYCCRFQEI
jgi:hypothetical protein